MTDLVDLRDALKRWQEHVYELLLERKAQLNVDPELCNKDRRYMLLDAVQSSLVHAWTQIDYSLPFEMQTVTREIFGDDKAREFYVASRADEQAGHAQDDAGKVCAANEGGIAETP